MSRKIPFISFMLTAVLMMALWFVMSGKTETKFIILGACSSILAALVCVRQLSIKGTRTDTVYYMLTMDPLKGLVYYLWLILQIIKSAIYVSRVALSGMKDVDPSIVWFKADYDNPAARALLANSITLTPGTITIDITDDGIYSVHALTRELCDGVLDGSMQAKVAWAYGETIDFHPVEAVTGSPRRDVKQGRKVRTDGKPRKRIRPSTDEASGGQDAGAGRKD